MSDTAPPTDEAVEPTDSAVEAQPVDLPELTGGAASGVAQFGILGGVHLDISVVVGSRRLPLADIARLSPGQVVQLEKSRGEPVELCIDGRPFARAEIVVSGEQLGARIVEMIERKGDQAQGSATVEPVEDASPVEPEAGGEGS